MKKPVKSTIEKGSPKYVIISEVPNNGAYCFYTGKTDGGDQFPVNTYFSTNINDAKIYYTKISAQFDINLNLSRLKNKQLADGGVAIIEIEKPTFSNHYHTKTHSDDNDTVWVKL